MKRLLAATICATLLITPTSANATSNAQLQRQVAALKKTNVLLKKTITRQASTISARNATIASLQAAAQTAATDLAAAKKQVTDTLAAAQASIDFAISQKLTALNQRDQALQGLPNSILAVPRADFPTLVFNPARQAWTCPDSFYTSGGYWSYSFDGGTAC